MELQVRTFELKDGTQGKSIRVGRMNETGMGMKLGEHLDFELCYEPSIRPVKMKDGSQFMSVSVLAEPLNNLEFFEPHLDKEYRSVNLALPNNPKIISILEKADTGDKFRIYLKPTTYRNEHKEKKAGAKFAIEQLEVVNKIESQEENFVKNSSSPSPVEIVPTTPKTSAKDADLPW